MSYKLKEDQASCARRYYERNKERVKETAIEFNAKARLRNRRFVWEYLSCHPCVDCGESDPVVLEFDHVRGTKRQSVSTAAGEGWSLSKLAKEIAKGDIRCANCHRRKTAKELGYHRDIRGLEQR